MEDDAAGSGSGKAERPTLLSFKEMPEWFQQDNNQWILHGYRPISGSVRASFRSWWYLHNETVNIYSHLIPAVLFLLGEWHILQHLSRKYARVPESLAPILLHSHSSFFRRLFAMHFRLFIILQ
jgi:adiponectin receptor